MSKFHYSENSDNHCEPIKRTGTLPPYWGWVQNATYAGKMKQKSMVLDKWEYSVSRCILFRWWSQTCSITSLLSISQVGGTRLEVGVSDSDPNTPHYFGRRMSTEVIKFEILIFNATAPSASIFNVPSECSAWILTEQTSSLELSVCFAFMYVLYLNPLPHT